MASPMISFDTHHTDMIHDAQMDYYSRKLATASSDRTVKIWNQEQDSCTLAATLQGHEGPVWQVSWAHPKFGVLLASCSYDGRVLIHRESPANHWTKIHEQATHESSVNAIAWAPHEYGLILGCASADGSISILTHQDDDSWKEETIPDGTRLGCNSISWAPITAHLTEQPTGQPAPLKFVTGSCDNNVRVWQRHQDGQWTPTQLMERHKDWVRDVAWAPSTGLASTMIASCSEDGSVCIWNHTNGEWNCTPLTEQPFDAPVWRVSWSVTGNLLAVSSGDHKVTLWKQSLDGSWEQVSEVQDAQQQQAS